MALTMQNTAARTELSHVQSIQSRAGHFIMGSMGASMKQKTFQLRNPVPGSAARLCLAMAQHDRLGAHSPLHVLDENILDMIARDYEQWHISRPFDSREAMEIEQLWLKGVDVHRLSLSFDRSLDCIRKLLLIENTVLNEDEMRDLERVIPKGHVICDVENYGGTVQRAAFCIIPSHFGVAGDGKPVCVPLSFLVGILEACESPFKEDAQLMSTLRQVLGYGELSPIMNR